MDSGYPGIFVMSWRQTEIDGLRAAPTDALHVGSCWRWFGEAVRVDAPAGPAPAMPETEAERRRRAARMVRRLLGAAISGKDLSTLPDEGDLPQQSFVLTDGRATYLGTMIDVPGSLARLVMFAGILPPRDADLWVVHQVIETRNTIPDPEVKAGVICFTPGTLIATPRGPRAIDELRPGDYLDTKDNGPQMILWTGRRHMTGARLFATPQLRPIRVRAGALGGERHLGDLVVSPGHRLLIQGREPATLFSAPEVLVAARDLVDGQGVAVDTSLREITYIHLMTERHEVLWANGMESETFHPAYTALDLVDPYERAALLALMPELQADPHSYGAYVRRSLSSPETAILRHCAA
jgi:hypothetical protein